MITEKGRYLIRDAGIIWEIAVLEISELAIKIEYLKTKAVVWYLKTEINSKWTLLEKLKPTPFNTCNDISGFLANAH